MPEDNTNAIAIVTLLKESRIEQQEVRREQRADLAALGLKVDSLAEKMEANRTLDKEHIKQGFKENFLVVERRLDALEREVSDPQNLTGGGLRFSVQTLMDDKKKRDERAVKIGDRFAGYGWGVMSWATIGTLGAIIVLILLGFKVWNASKN